MHLTGGCGISCETQVGSPGLHRLDAECDVLFQRTPEFLRALDDVLAADAARERLVLGFLCVFTTTRLLDPSTLLKAHSASQFHPHQRGGHLGRHEQGGSLQRQRIRNHPIHCNHRHRPDVNRSRLRRSHAPEALDRQYAPLVA